MRFAFALLLLLCGTALAQDSYPSRPVHILVPFTPGTGADILARVFGPKLSERMKVGFVVDNRAGDTGNIGAAQVAKSPPDGYTLLLTATSFSTTPALKPAPFDPVKDFAPVILLSTGALGVYVHPQVPAKSMREFVDLVRSQPGKLHYSSPGNGGPQHLAMELFKLETGIDIVHVPYKGLAGAITDAMAGHVQAMISATQTAHSAVQSGRLRMLAVLSPERSPAYPDTPTVKELGLAQVEVETWYGSFAPAGTPQFVVAKFNAELNALLKLPDVRESLAKQGMTPRGGTPERFGNMVRAELTRWDRVVKAANIKAD